MPTMTNIELRLEDVLLPGQAGYKAPLTLEPANGYVPQSLNIGFPEVREVSDKKPSANGTFDFTQFFGAGGVQLVVAIASELASGKTETQLLDDLKGWMDPRRRTWIYYRYSPSEAWRKIKVRTTQLTRSYNFIKSNFGMVSMGWKSIDGVSKGTTLVDVFVAPGGATEAGRVYDLTPDRSYPTSTPIGVSYVTNEGNADVLPFIRIYGPCDQPRIENRTTGLKMEFLSSYSILTGEYLDIDFENGTVYLNGLSTNSRYDKIDFNVSNWWSLIPGVNEIRFYPLTFSAPSTSEIIFEPNFF